MEPSSNAAHACCAPSDMSVAVRPVPRSTVAGRFPGGGMYDPIPAVRKNLRPKHFTLTSLSTAQVKATLFGIRSSRNARRRLPEPRSISVRVGGSICCRVAVPGENTNLLPVLAPGCEVVGMTHVCPYVAETLFAVSPAPRLTFSAGGAFLFEANHRSPEIYHWRIPNAFKLRSFFHDAGVSVTESSGMNSPRAEVRSNHRRRTGFVCWYHRPEADRNHYNPST